ncbi:MAG: hypothetical protein AAF497_02605 [Planctomycetota bacterium]
MKFSPAQVAMAVGLGLVVFSFWVFSNKESPDYFSSLPTVEQTEVRSVAKCVLLTNNKNFKPDYNTKIIARRSYDESSTDLQLTKLINEIDDSDMVFGFVHRPGADGVDHSYTLIPRFHARSLSRPERLIGRKVGDGALIQPTARILRSPQPFIRLQLKLGDDPELVELEARLPQILISILDHPVIIAIDEISLNDASTIRVGELVCEVSKAGDKWDTSVSYTRGEEVEKVEANSVSGDQLLRSLVRSCDKATWKTGGLRAAGPLERFGNGLDRKVQIWLKEHDYDAALDLLRFKQYIEPDSPDVKLELATVMAQRAFESLESALSAKMPARRLEVALEESEKALDEFGEAISDGRIDIQQVTMLFPDLEPSKVPTGFHGEIGKTITRYRRQVRRTLVNSVEAQPNVESRDVLILKALPWLTRSPDWYGESAEEAIEVRRRLLRSSRDLPSSDFIVEALLFGGSSDASGRVAYRFANVLVNELDKEQIQRLSRLSTFHSEFFSARVN